jgi:hypothetical protein
VDLKFATRVDTGILQVHPYSVVLCQGTGKFASSKQNNEHKAKQKKIIEKESCKLILVFKIFKLALYIHIYINIYIYKIDYWCDFFLSYRSLCHKNISFSRGIIKVRPRPGWDLRVLGNNSKCVFWSENSKFIIIYRSRPLHLFIPGNLGFFFHLWKDPQISGLHPSFEHKH